jgi:uncharacterized protein
MAHNPVVWWELASRDAESSVAFFREVFGWALEFDEDAGFWVMPADLHDQHSFVGGGIFTLRRARRPFVALYITVEDIEAKAHQIVQAGGTIVEGPFFIGSGSMICLFKEPSGVVFGMLQRARRP